MIDFTEEIEYEIEYFGTHGMPEYKTSGSSGMDLCAEIEESVVLEPYRAKLIPTGIKVALPVGIEMQIRCRSGLALKNQIIVLNAPGTVDSDYRGEVGVILFNASDTAFTIEPGMRIAQAVLAHYVNGKPILVDKIREDTERGAGGYGHTGVK